MSVRLIRNSERYSFKKCEQQWWWNFVDLLKPAEVGKALRFGDLIHQSLAAYYKKGVKRGPHPSKTFRKLYQASVEELGELNMRPDDDEKWLEADELGCAMLDGYVEKYGERDKEYKVISSEQTFQMPLVATFPREINCEALGLPRKLKFNIVGTLDGVWEHRSSGALIFKEFKTASNIDPAPLAMDEQAGTYWTFAPKWLWQHGYLEKGVYPESILYTFLRKAMPDTRPTNEAGLALNMDGSVSKKQPAKNFDRFPIFRDEADRHTMHKRVLEEALRMELIRYGLFKPIKSPGPLYMPNCRGCGFKDMCELQETGGDWEEFRDATMITWDPYGAHEIIERW